MTVRHKTSRDGAWQDLSCIDVGDIAREVGLGLVDLASVLGDRVCVLSDTRPAPFKILVDSTADRVCSLCARLSGPCRDEIRWSGRPAQRSAASPRQMSHAAGGARLIYGDAMTPATEGRNT
jgi:hypothetical protein